MKRIGIAIFSLLFLSVIAYAEPPSHIAKSIQPPNGIHRQIALMTEKEYLPLPDENETEAIPISIKKDKEVARTQEAVQNENTVVTSASGGTCSSGSCSTVQYASNDGTRSYTRSSRGGGLLGRIFTRGSRSCSSGNCP